MTLKPERAKGNAGKKRKSEAGYTSNLREAPTLISLKKNCEPYLSESILSDLRGVMDIYGEIIPPLSV